MSRILLTGACGLLLVLVLLSGCGTPVGYIKSPIPSCEDTPYIIRYGVGGYEDRIYAANYTVDENLTLTVSRYFRPYKPWLTQEWVNESLSLPVGTYLVELRINYYKNHHGECPERTN